MSMGKLAMNIFRLMLVLGLRNSCAKSGNFSENGIGSCVPCKGSAIGVVLLDKTSYLSHVTMHTLFWERINYKKTVI